MQENQIQSLAEKPYTPLWIWLLTSSSTLSSSSMMDDFRLFGLRGGWDC